MEQARRYRFPKRMRLTRQREFDCVIQRGRKLKVSGMSVFYLPNDLGYPRLGISLGRKCRPSVKRNTIKRRIREAFRLSQHNLPAIDIVFIVYEADDKISIEHIMSILKRISDREGRRCEFHQDGI